MNNLFILLIVIVLIIFFNIQLNKNNDVNINNGNSILPKFPKNHRELIPKNGFVKPQHRLLNLLNDISSADKIYLKNVISKRSYTSKTIEPEYNEHVVLLLKVIVSSLNNVSETDFFIKGIDNLYVVKDDDNNIRFIVDAFMFDVKNHYTIRFNTDIVIFKGETYLNFLDIDESAINNILNNYDVKYQAQGILSKYDMFTTDVESILNEYYKHNYKVIGVNKSSLEFDSTMLSSIFTLDQLSRNYLPSGVPNQNAPYFCKKDSSKFDSHGVNFINNVSKDCISNNNSVRKYPNSPYESPVTIKDRVDFNAYDWLKNPQHGNIIYSHGFH